MKSFIKAWLLIIATGVSLQAAAQNLFTYGTHGVKQEEFLKAYSKNNTDTKPTAQSYRDYLNLYIRFKLKVQAALDLHLDTLPGQVAELKNFRSQIAESYMNDEASINALIDEAMDRSTKDIQVSHLFIAVSKTASAQEVEKARLRAEDLYSRVQKGEDFGRLAAEYSEDPEARNNKGQLGYITTFVLPYDIENVVYSIPTGAVSKPFRSSIGFHLFKKTAERKALGRIRVAQILLSFPPDASTQQKEAIKERADSIYKVLKGGADFKNMALQFSNDNISYQNGGEMQEFGVGRYEPSFELTAFSLKQDEEIGAPVATSYGYHIIKRLRLIPVTVNKTNIAERDNYRQIISANDRIVVSRSALLKKIQQQTGYKKFPYNQAAFEAITQNALEGKPKLAKQAIGNNQPLFGFRNKNITMGDWLNYVDAIKGIETLRNGNTTTQLLEKYTEATALEYYRDHLEEFNKDFAYQLREFKEGNLLFEVMQRKIWDIASLDTAGLQQYYKAHKNNYWWEASADALIVTATSDSIATAAKARFTADISNWKKILDISDGTLQGDSGRFELGQLPVIERTAFTPGLMTANVKNETDNSATFCYILKVYNNREPRSFQDARGFVINDYQTYLEEKWVTELKKKYPVTVNEAVFKKLKG